MADYDILLRDHVSLTCRSIDRLCLQGYVPQLQSVGRVCRFLLGRGYRIPSSAAFGRIGDAYVAEIHRWAEVHEIPVIRFAKGEHKEAIARPLMEWGRQMAFINHFYLLPVSVTSTCICPDSEWGPAFWKTNAYALYPVWLWLNGHEWAKRQLELAGIGYVALDNGLRSCTDPAALQRI